MRTYRKTARTGEIELYEEALNPLADQYNPSFSTLTLPHAIEVRGEKILLPFYEGETFNDRWNDATGGALLGLDLSSEVPVMLRELAQIETEDIVKNARLKRIPKLAFDHGAYLCELESSLRRFVAQDLLTPEESARAKEILKEPFTSKVIFNNGDFYPRNFIRTPEGRIVLIDWETWNDRSPFYILDHPENVAAVCYVHMWGNRPWREQYVSGLRRVAGLRERDCQKAILIKSLEMANFWLGNDRLRRIQIALFREALEGRFPCAQEF